MADRHAAFAHLTFNRPDDGILEVVPDGPNLNVGLVVAG
jgi:hypothetical protein